jgi:hypothetical protein
MRVGGCASTCANVQLSILWSRRGERGKRVNGNGSHKRCDCSTGSGGSWTFGNIVDGAASRVGQLCCLKARNRDRMCKGLGSKRRIRDRCFDRLLTDLYSVDRSPAACNGGRIGQEDCQGGRDVRNGLGDGDGVPVGNCRACRRRPVLFPRISIPSNTFDTVTDMLTPVSSPTHQPDRCWKPNPV